VGLQLLAASLEWDRLCAPRSMSFQCQVGQPSCRVIVHPEWLGIDKAQGASLSGYAPGRAGMWILREAVRSMSECEAYSGRWGRYQLETTFIMR
jgi:hypothetical protein